MRPNPADPKLPILRGMASAYGLTSLTPLKTPIPNAESDIDPAEEQTDYEVMDRLFDIATGPFSRS
jgi:hypothetical protein